MNSAIKNATRLALLAIAAVLTLGSCIRDDIKDCPPLHVNIIVKDKNYFNVDTIEPEDRLPEDLAFREYVPTLYWTVKDVETGQVIATQELHKVTGDVKSIDIDFPENLPHGTYAITAWGGLKDIGPLGDDYTTLLNHPECFEGDDVYVTHDTLVYDPTHYDYTVEMERTKGKLIVQCENFPAEVSFQHKNMRGLAEVATHLLRYSGETNVIADHTRDIDDPRFGWVTKTVLAPTTPKGKSMLSAQFLEAGDVTTEFWAGKIEVPMHRNKISIVRFVWGNDGMKIYILIDANWAQIVHLVF